MMGKMLAVLLCGAGLAAPIAAAGTLPIEWTINPAGSNSGGDRVQLTLSQHTARGGRSMNSRPFPLGDLQGLSPTHLASAGSPASFRIVREAGMLNCQGVVRHQRGTGECSFVPNDRFASELERRGIGRPTEQQQYQLAIHNVGLALVDELERHGYRRPSLDKLAAAGIHGVTIPYVRSFHQAGYPLADIEDLLKFRIHNVDAAYVREMATLNGASTRFSTSEILAMRIHGLSAEKARELAQLGYKGLSHKQLTAMSIHSVSPDYIREMAAAGYRGLSAEQLIAMRIHGVTPAFAREMRRVAKDAPSAAQLVSMRIHGVKQGRAR